MTTFDYVMVGKALRNKRKEKRLRIEDLADENISTSTISNIERGHHSVTPEKVEYYGEKLDIQLQDFAQLVQQIHETDANTDFILYTIQNTLDLGSPREQKKAIKKRLETLKIKENTPHYVVKLFLKGRYHMINRSMTQAINCLTDAIRFSDDFPILTKMNIKALSYYDLGRTHHYLNSFESAICYAEMGMQCYNPDGEVKTIIYSLKISQVIYYERLDNIEAALKIIHELWKEKEFIQNKFVQLSMYEVKSKILKRQKMYDEAIAVAREGIELARINLIHERAFELWLTLASIYLHQEQLTVAENCLITADSFKENVGNNYLLISLHTFFAVLYLKQDRSQEAHTSAQEAVRLGEETNDAPRLTLALISLGDCLQMNRQYEEAVTTYQRALDIANFHEFKPHQHVTLMELNKCLKHVDRIAYTQNLEKLLELNLQLSDSRLMLI
ncbi:helix-turn-helix transcriptional regulator [Hazenella sp. IB182357]|uniref:Helix-turn-helix transcriptional regulator n=1 Tax=Polycladospora coralii TaxID=2771432 RepID=A0A926NC24_9BACL|nr:helix-turn-helix transcriptional regulator [Polycladospora coralii]MBD1373853.1 helix-turn-helix transcriptional regulator [Polycladospora coralii]